MPTDPGLNHARGQRRYVESSVAQFSEVPRGGGVVRDNRPVIGSQRREQRGGEHPSDHFHRHSGRGPARIMLTICLALTPRYCPELRHVLIIRRWLVSDEHSLSEYYVVIADRTG